MKRLINFLYHPNLIVRTGFALFQGGAIAIIAVTVILYIVSKGWIE